MVDKLENGIVIIGMVCWFFGDVDSFEKYWLLLCDGIDVIMEVFVNCWDIEKYYNFDKN